MGRKALFHKGKAIDNGNYFLHSFNNDSAGVYFYNALPEKMMTRPEIYFVINKFIGVTGGYLGDFSYRTHREFYPAFCDLDIDPEKYVGTTKDRFQQVLSNADQYTQSKILVGLLKKYPLESFPEDKRDIKFSEINQIEKIIQRLVAGDVVVADNLEISSEVVERAIQDTKVLLEKNGAISSVDSIHTALHGYLKAVCKKENITLKEDSSLTESFKILKEQHTVFKTTGPRQEEIDQIIKAFSNVLDKLNPIRNKASMAHPNEELLHEDEAVFVMNAAHTVKNYLNRKFKVKAK